ncbi:MAG TPA: GNAT family N-acetyltransferase [Flavobacteriales bacterium]|nr:GNAT family N-acetyltransferase [Flavobacteriales bacterium]
MSVIYRKGTKTDVPELLACIKELARYEKAEDQVEVNEAELLRDGFGPNPIYEFLVAELDLKIIGIALYYYKYSTWKGKALFLEDLIVKEEYRRTGAGTHLFIEVCKIAHKQKCRRMDWQVLDWNTPAIEFYRKFEAKLDPEWLDGRLFKNDLERISGLI